MRKRILPGILCLLCTVFCILLGTGCASEELLTEVPQTIYLTPVPMHTEDSQAKASSSEEALEALAEDPQESAVPREISLLEPDASSFAYRSLSYEKQLWYKDIEQALGSMQETVRLAEEGLQAGLDETCIDTIFQCVLNDHPELFYVKGYTYTKYSRGEKTVAIDFSGTYEMSPEQAVSRRQEILSATAPILAGIPGGASDYDKVKYVFDTIIRNTDYDLNAPDNQNIYSVFLGHASVCQGYAKATQYLLNHLGVECTMVQGAVDTGEGHAWNLVQVDGSYYYVDTTWGDASYQLEDGSAVEEAMLPEINYDYLCVTTKQLLRTHTLDSFVPMPECVSMDANYYVREGAYFTSYDKEQLTALFERSLVKGQKDVTVKCADSNCYQSMYQALIEQQEIFDYLPESNKTVSYAHNEKQLSLTFWVTNQ